MLRRDPTTIHLVAEDIKDVGSYINDFELHQDSDIGSSLKVNHLFMNHDVDTQNWDSSLDESYLGSRNRDLDQGKVVDTEHAIKLGRNTGLRSDDRDTERESIPHNANFNVSGNDDRNNNNSSNMAIDDNLLLGSLADADSKYGKQG